MKGLQVVTTSEVEDQALSTSSHIEANAATLQRELDWFSQVLDLRVKLYFQQESELTSIEQVLIPELCFDHSHYALWVKKHLTTMEERLVLVMAMIPHIKPQLFDTFFIRNSNFDRAYTEFGGKQGQTHSGFLPTCETAAFVVSGEDLTSRFNIAALFEVPHPFLTQNVLSLNTPSEGEPFFSSAFSIQVEYLNLFTTGVTEKLDYSNQFPAKLITSELDWSDLVLAHEVMSEIDKIRTWIKHSAQILDEWGLSKSLKPGYRSLFYGPPGTGKTLTATLIGAELGLDVYRIDLSSMVSKYIGETEKNLANLFDQACNKRWILFFDEADALFGSRTQSGGANERHANQEIAYLLQRIEDFPGIVILATNLRANIDDAFSRRFQSLIYFPMPDAEQRYQLWLNMLNGHYPEGETDSLRDIAEKHELAGGAIANVIRYAAISAVQSGYEKIDHHDLCIGIAKELRKEGRTI
ncbi:ATP-binding protein [Shewanella sp. YLB-07]|uniref:ATP-binding protein n=1 Tax=Shewanella sp. YLB-07 TaxID=2601268 RepID=UPI00128C1B1C|nr:ATP-binding protein [Shewanella sp. YLB-07]MPY23408.1 ATP-binding protein [Shewanella sp. YLB-07]